MSHDEHNVCRCGAYRFPHRKSSGRCGLFRDEEDDLRSLERGVRRERTDEETELYLFNRAEARAINRENRRGL